MTTITRERVAEIIHAAGLEPCDYEEVFGSIKTGEIVAIARIALVSLEAEAVLYAAEETLAYAEHGELHLTCLSEPMGDAVIPLYSAPPTPVVDAEPVAWTSEKALAEVYCGETGMIGPQYMVGNVSLYRHAPPATVSVPDEMTMADAILEIDAKDADRWTGRIGFQKGWNACRSAMLKAAPKQENI